MQPPVVRQHLVDDPPGSFRLALVAVMSGSDDERFPQRPAAAARPGLFVERQRVTERLAAVAGKLRPGDRQVAGGIAGGRAAEIDDAAQPSIFDQQIAPGDVAMDPDWSALPSGA